MKKLLIMLYSCFVLMACQQPNRENMTVQVINKGWTYQEVDGEHKGNATVPGTIHTDLLNEGHIEDPFYRNNEAKLQWIDKQDWVYTTSFDVDAGTLKKDRVELHFYGLDTYADIYVNGHLLKETNNMHREWSVDVKEYIHLGANQLKIYLHSPIKKGLALYDAAAYAYPATNDQSENGGLGDKKVSVFTRKAGYHYGWDWGPRFVTSGIWRPVELRSWNDLRLQSVYIQQPQVTAELAKLIADVNIESEKQMQVKLRVKHHEKVLAEQVVAVERGINNVTLPFEITKPKLWWSKGLGEANMYDFKIEVKNEENSMIAKQTLSTGLRSVRLVREKDEAGESFLFELNGVRVFAKGANYIPNDSFLPRVTKADYEKVVADAVDANMNMLRIWGGGIYEDDYFYELCDRNGIMVWQDFMFACSMYPGDEAMLDNIKHEAIDNVKRLRNHPAIVLWCGNNEINTAWHHYGQGGWGWKQRYATEQQEGIQKAYLDIFHRVLPEVVEEYTNSIDYWPSSPQAGYEPDKHAGYDTSSGDMHYWGVWHGLHPFSDFDQYQSRFMSEYGFQSFPDFETVKTYAEPGDYNIESDVMAAHQRSGIGNLRIKEYMSWYYEVPDDFEQFLYMSQVLQAHGMRMGIEAHRRAMPYCMGSLYWQINDCWPVASWSSTDYYHKWKSMHYAVREAFSPVMISAINSGEEVEVYVVSDLLENKQAILELKIMDFNGNQVYKAFRDITINANASTKLPAISINDIEGLNVNYNVLVLNVVDETGILCSKNHYFANAKDLLLPKAELDISVLKEGDDTYLEVHSDALIRSLYLYDNRSGLVLNDNYFDVLPGETKKVKVLSCRYPVEYKEVNFRHIKH
ncbi:glycoside hydrolase family 2 protein [Carboxylicivirga mesophila]|uniref:Beta-mannosidase B n=1 Tax=Carboxylicivirga mesophila TaxID=1166478 RepID=A0ABS5KAF3_9BACT|nr:glycoside hydrolase family 2 protein [Carboxylicivirga mesophila]MBS2211956.1 glycoside hydrolase family 2 protein [Carboxylicivirga mesophila]